MIGIYLVRNDLTIYGGHTQNDWPLWCGTASRSDAFCFRNMRSARGFSNVSEIQK